VIDSAGSFRSFWRDAPGRRFAHRHERLNQHGRGWFGRALRWVLGVLLVLLGIVFGPLPGPGFVPLLAGAALLAGESMHLAAWLDRAELRVRRWLGRD